VASQLGITRDRLASYEAERAPLRFEVAARFCRQFIISERWLATGKGPIQQLLLLNQTQEFSKVPPGALFSDAYDLYLKTWAERRSEAIGDKVFALDIFGPGLWPDRLLFKNLFALVLDEWLSKIPEELQQRLLIELYNVGARVVREHGKPSIK
jgi:hypothetical protein